MSADVIQSLQKLNDEKRDEIVQLTNNLETARACIKQLQTEKELLQKRLTFIHDNRSNSTAVYFGTASSDEWFAQVDGANTGAARKEVQ